MNTDEHGFFTPMFKCNLPDLRLKPRQLFQFFYAMVDVSALDLRGAGQAKALAAERRRDAAVNHRAPDVGINRAFRGGEITHHAPDERIARAGWVHDFGQRIGRANEKPLWPGQNRAVRTFFYDHILWTQLVDFFQRGKDV